jgi:hypothetical protein
MESLGKGVHMLPPPPDCCQECAVKHDPLQPHNKDSMYYQYHFANKEGRWPTWADAMAHCQPHVRAVWKAELEKRGMWSEPKCKLSKEERVARILGDMPMHTEKRTMKPGNIVKTKIIRKKLGIYDSEKEWDERNKP